MVAVPAKLWGANSKVDKPYGPSALILEQERGTVLMQDAHVLFKNFEGRKKEYNADGDRNFCVILDPGIVPDMLEDGWNIKQLKPQPDGTEGDFYIQVTVRYDNRPPNIFLRNSRGRHRVDEQNVELLDYVDAKQWDLILSPYVYTVNGRSGVKAYLQSMVVHQHEDYLELMYADEPVLDDPVGVPVEEQDANAGLDNSGHTVVQGEVVGD